MASKISVSRFCRRRLPLVMIRNKMAQTLQAAVKFVEQGHVRVGPELVTDPAYLVTRRLEDYVTWTDVSAIKKQVLDYNGLVGFFSKNIFTIFTLIKIEFFNFLEGRFRKLTICFF